jgi:hypothetical protein
MAAIEYLQRAGLAVEVIGGNLRLSPVDRITDAVRVFVHDHKPALLVEAKAYRPEAAGAAWWRGVLLELRCTKAHLLACGVVDEPDITPKALGEYVALGTTPKAFAVALRRCERWRPS